MKELTLTVPIQCCTLAYARLPDSRSLASQSSQAQPTEGRPSAEALSRVRRLNTGLTSSLTSASSSCSGCAMDRDALASALSPAAALLHAAQAASAQAASKPASLIHAICLACT